MRTSDTKMLQKKKLQQAEEDDVQNLNFQLWNTTWTVISFVVSNPQYNTYYLIRRERRQDIVKEQCKV
jgi:hypothetical protein